MVYWYIHVYHRFNTLIVCVIYWFNTFISISFVAASCSSSSNSLRKLFSLSTSCDIFYTISTCTTSANQLRKKSEKEKTENYFHLICHLPQQSFLFFNQLVLYFPLLKLLKSNNSSNQSVPQMSNIDAPPLLQ